MKSFFRVPYYPLLLAAYPIVYLTAVNISIVSPAEPLRPLLLALGFAAGLQLAFRLVLKNWHRAALLTALMLALFFSFGHVANMLTGIALAGLGWTWLGIFLALFLAVMRFRNAEHLTAPLNVFMLTVLAFSLVSAGQYLFQKSETRPGIPEMRALLADLRGDARAGRTAFTPAATPDIYFIVLDSYQRADTLQSYYNFDNSPFIEALRARGFYIASQSRSNYLSTSFSIPATLNLVYLNDLPHPVFTEIISGLRINHAADFLRERGYQTVHFPAGYWVTDTVNADIWAAPESPTRQPQSQPAISQFDLLLLRTTLGRLLIPTSREEVNFTDAEISEVLNQNFDERRARLEYTFTHLPDYARDSRSSFVFAHMILPHNPYLYDARGTPLAYDGQEFLLGDKSDSQQNIQLYTDQLQYTNTRMLEVIDRILEHAITPPIIVIQADHGHDTFFEFEALTSEGVDQRSAIINAVYFPGGDYQALYETITPVNTFRVIFNQTFGADYPLLPDRSYVHPRPAPNSFNTIQEFTPIESYLSQLPVP